MLTASLRIRVFWTIAVIICLLASPRLKAAELPLDEFIRYGFRNRYSSALCKRKMIACICRR